MKHMDLQMQTRRRFLATIGGVAVLMSGPVPLLRIAGGMNGPAVYDEEPFFASDLEQVTAWIARLRQQQINVLAGPVSRLQREFRLGYRRACALAQRLEQHGEWTIFFDGAGARSARIHPFPPQF
jgi:DNA segregation ATPase FtsK/SpoIIIE-like protein